MKERGRREKEDEREENRGVTKGNNRPRVEQKNRRMKNNKNRSQN
jgi:hypothetical protein